MTTRKFTTADLENLTEGTTPGPWEWDDHHVPTLNGSYLSSMGTHRFTDAVIEADHDGGCGCRSSCELELHVGDKDRAFIAALPELAADYHRVRTELEQLREGYLGMAREEARDGHHLSAQWNADAAFALGRILNGDNHE